MIWWLSMALAADPASLRHLDGEGAAVDVGTEAMGVAATVGGVSLGLDHAYGATLAVHAGMRRNVVGEERAWRIDGLGAVGLAGLLATPGVAVVVTGELRGGLHAEHVQATLGLVAPVAVRIDVPPQLAAPLGLELRLAAHVSRSLWVGARGQAGGTLVAGGAPAGRAVVAGFVTLRPGGQ